MAGETGRPMGEGGQDPHVTEGVRAPGALRQQAVLDGRFELQETLGSGGMAAVYRAWDRTLRRICAVKVLSDLLSRDEESRRRFRREAEAARGLTHPGVVEVSHYGEAAPYFYIVMEYVPGGTLRDALDRRPVFGEVDALRIAAEIAEALAYAHGRGVVHRDIKPHNVLLTEDGRVKVADFGIARTLDATSLTRTGTVMGSAQYISPEQARGDSAGPQSDLYALGIVLFEMLAGRVPFDGEASVAIALKHLRDAPPDLPAIRPDLSAATYAVVARLLAKSPADRYPSAAALAADLRRIASARSVQRRDIPADLAKTDRFPALLEPSDTGPQATSELAAASPFSGDAAAQTARLTSTPAGAEREVPPGGTAVLPSALDPGLGREAALPPARRPRLVWARAGLFVATTVFAVGLGAAVYRAGWTAAHAIVPTLVGRSMAAAAEVVLPLQLGVVVIGQRQDSRAGVGVIVAQDPPPGREVLKGFVIRLTVSQGSGLVPDLHGLAVSEAIKRLEAVGLRLGRVSYTYDDAVARGNVIYQFQTSGSRLPSNGPVDILVSQGPPQAPAPSPEPPSVPNQGGDRS